MFNQPKILIIFMIKIVNLWKDQSLGKDFSLILSENKEIYVIGNNNNCQISNDKNVTKSKNLKKLDLKNINKISAGIIRFKFLLNHLYFRFKSLFSFE
jgi:alpha-tubulin suppressor-like RCC1 family protein